MERIDGAGFAIAFGGRSAKKNGNSGVYMRSDSHDTVVNEAVANDAPNARRVWVAPHYSKMRAGDAELGPNPDAHDDTFSYS